MTESIIDLDEKRLEKLPPKELSAHLMRLPAKKRLEVILQRPDAESVVAAMAEQDFYLSVKEVGPDDALALLGLARVDQLHHLFDLEWWQKDMVQPARAVDWLERLASASEEKLLQWLYHVDFELLVTLFKRWIKVEMVADDMDPLEARDFLPRHTLDDQYYWETRYPQYEEFFTQLLGIIYEVHYGFYKELMNHILWTTDVEQEEEAYRFHRARLEDRAIPDFYEALEIYRAMRLEEIDARKEVRQLEDDGPSPPSFAVASIPDQDLLARALRQIRDRSLIDHLQLELASLANKVVVADQLPPDNPEALHQAVEKVDAYVNLGLHLKSAGLEGPALTILRDVYLEDLFRLGHTQVLRVSNRMRMEYQQGWLSRWPKKLSCLDPQWMEAAELLLARTPRLLKPSSAPGAAAREDLFRTETDLQQGRHLIDVVAAVGTVFDALQVRPERIEKVLWHQGQMRDLESITLGAMLWTAAARFHLEGKWTVDPIPVKAWADLFPRLEPQAMERTIRKWVQSLSPDPSWRATAETYLDPLFRTYAEEMMPFFEGGLLPDPRLVKFFLFMEG